MQPCGQRQVAARQDLRRRPESNRRSHAITPAIATSCCWPPDRSNGERLQMCSICSSRMACMAPHRLGTYPIPGWKGPWRTPSPRCRRNSRLEPLAITTVRRKPVRFFAIEGLRSGRSPRSGHAMLDDASSLSWVFLQRTACAPMWFCRRHCVPSTRHCLAFADAVIDRWLNTSRSAST